RDSRAPRPRRRRTPGVRHRGPPPPPPPPSPDTAASPQPPPPPPPPHRRPRPTSIPSGLRPHAATGKGQLVLHLGPPPTVHTRPTQLAARPAPRRPSTPDASPSIAGRVRCPDFIGTVPPPTNRKGGTSSLASSTPDHARDIGIASAAQQPRHAVSENDSPGLRF